MGKRVFLAIGSSMGNKTLMLSDARDFLSELSASEIRCSSIWETEPVGIAKNQFYNAVVQISYDGTPAELLKRIKNFEKDAGRDQDTPRWTDRPIDIDIIDFGGSYYLDSDLEVPHPRYSERLFVLSPLQDLEPFWMDPLSGDHIEDMIKKAPPIRLSKITAKW
jgi:2-amino-4-hydroxy-6-hydroxymethyldihydropteridine diphosphokinase